MLSNYWMQKLIGKYSETLIKEAKYGILICNWPFVDQAKADNISVLEKFRGKAEPTWLFLGVSCFY